MGDPLLQIRFLGQCSLCYAGRPLTSLNTARLQALLACLVLDRDAPQSRQQLAFRLWPETTEAQARTNLRNLLHRLRRALPESERFLNTGVHTLQWSAEAPFTLDVADFEQASRPDASVALLKEAVQLYRGDLLPGCYDEWVEPRREQLRRRYVRSLKRLIQLYEEQRQYEAGIEYAQRLLQCDPLEEAGYAALMRLQLLNGDRAGALRTYRQCESVLEKELATRPSGSMRRLREQLTLQVEPAAPPSPPASGYSPLVGRHEAWRALMDLLNVVQAGTSRFVVITGEAGIGKTHLAEEFRCRAERMGAITASARAYLAEGGLAYAPVADWLRAGILRNELTRLEAVWLAEIARILPDLLVEHPHVPPPGPLTENWQRRRFFEALARAVRAGKRPVLLLLDDLQWCDRETLAWLNYVVRFEGGAPLLMAGTLRTGEIDTDHPLAGLTSELRREGMLTEIALGPISASETKELAAHVLGRDLSPAEGERLHRESEGNPLFAIEMLRAGMLKPAAESRVHGSPGTASEAGRLPSSVLSVINARLARLSSTAREVVNVAAVVGRDFSFEVLQAATSDTEDTLVRGLEELMERGIVREHGDATYDFSHDKIREAAYGGISHMRRRLLHRNVAEAMERIYASNLDSVIGQVAVHYERAGRAERAVACYERASQAAVRMFANEDAVTFLQRARLLLSGELLARGNGFAGVRARVEEQLGDRYLLLGQYDEALAAFGNVLAHVRAPDPVLTSRIHCKIGKVRNLQHDYEAALEAFGRALQALMPEPGQPSPGWWHAWIDVHLNMLWVHYWLSQVGSMAEVVERAAPAIQRHGTLTQRAHYYWAVTCLSLRRDRFVVTDETMNFARLQYDLFRQAGDVTALAAAQFTLGFTLLWYGNLEEAEQQIASAMDTAKRTGDVILQARCLAYRAVMEWKRGRIEQVRYYAEQGRAVAERAHMPEYVGMAEGNMAWAAWREERLSETITHGQAALAAWGQLSATHALCPFKWIALWPLIGATLASNPAAGTTRDGIRYAKAMLDPLQQPQPDDVRTLLEAAVQAWEKNEPEAARTRLLEALSAAHALNLA